MILFKSSFWIFWLLLVNPSPGEAKPPSVEKHNGSLFLNHGNLISGLSWGHILVDIKLHDLYVEFVNHRELAQQFHLITTQAIGNGSVPLTTNQKRAQYYSSHNLDIIQDLDHRLQEINNGFKYRVQAAPSKVHKRQVMFLLAGALIGGAVTSLFTQFSAASLTNILKNKVDVISSKVEENMVNIAQNTAEIRRLNHTMYEVAAVLGRVLLAQTQTDSIILGAMVANRIETFSRRVNKLQEALDSIYVNKFHRDLISTETLWQAMAQIKDASFKKGLLMGVHNLAELYQLPASFIYDDETATVHIIVHIPLYHESHILTLYRYVNTPVQVPWQTSSYFELQPSKGYLARNRDGTLTKTLSEEELNDCLNIAHIYFCNDKALRKRNRPTCLNSLFDGLTESIISECPGRLSSKVSELTKLGVDRYLVSESEKLRVLADCPESGSVSKTFAVDVPPGTHILTLDPGCTTTSDNWVIGSTASIDDIRVDSVIIPNLINVNDFLAGIEEEHMETVFQSLKEIGQPIALSQVKGLAAYTSQMKAIDRKYALVSATFTTAGIITTLVIGGILIFCCCNGGKVFTCTRGCCQKHEKHRHQSEDDEEEEQYAMRAMMSRNPESTPQAEAPPAAQLEPAGGTAGGKGAKAPKLKDQKLVLTI